MSASCYKALSGRPIPSVKFGTALGKRHEANLLGQQGQAKLGSEGEALGQPAGREPPEPGRRALGELGHLLLHLCHGILRRRYACP